MVVELNSGGGIRVHFKFDNKRLQVNTIMGPGIEFANAQRHIIKFQRLAGGKIMRLQVGKWQYTVRGNICLVGISVYFILYYSRACTIL